MPFYDTATALGGELPMSSYLWQRHHHELQRPADQERENGEVLCAANEHKIVR